MTGYDVEEAKFFILSRLDRKAYRSIASQLPRIIGEMIAYDLHFMRGSAKHVALDFGHNIRREVDICTRILEIIGLV